MKERLDSILDTQNKPNSSNINIAEHDSDSKTNIINHTHSINSLSKNSQFSPIQLSTPKASKRKINTLPENSKLKASKFDSSNKKKNSTIQEYSFDYKILYPDDSRDKVFIAILKALVLVKNKPCAPKELSNIIIQNNLTVLGGATPYATVSSRISQHFKRVSSSNFPRESILGRVSNSDNPRKILYYLLPQSKKNSFFAPSVDASKESSSLSKHDSPFTSDFKLPNKHIDEPTDSVSIRLMNNPGNKVLPIYNNRSKFSSKAQTSSLKSSFTESLLNYKLSNLKKSSSPNFSDSKSTKNFNHSKPAPKSHLNSKEKPSNSSGILKLKIKIKPTAILNKENTYTSPTNTPNTKIQFTDIDSKILLNSNLSDKLVPAPIDSLHINSLSARNSQSDLLNSKSISSDPLNPLSLLFNTKSNNHSSKYKLYKSPTITSNFLAGSPDKYYSLPAKSKRKIYSSADNDDSSDHEFYESTPIFDTDASLLNIDLKRHKPKQGRGKWLPKPINTLNTCNSIDNQHTKFSPEIYTTTDLIENEHAPYSSKFDCSGNLNINELGSSQLDKNKIIDINQNSPDKLSHFTSDSVNKSSNSFLKINKNSSDKTLSSCGSFFYPEHPQSPTPKKHNLDINITGNEEDYIYFKDPSPQISKLSSLSRSLGSVHSPSSLKISKSNSNTFSNKQYPSDSDIPSSVKSFQPKPAPYNKNQAESLPNSFKVDDSDSIFDIKLTKNPKTGIIANKNSLKDNELGLSVSYSPILSNELYEPGLISLSEIDSLWNDSNLKLKEGNEFIDAVNEVVAQNTIKDSKSPSRSLFDVDKFELYSSTNSKALADDLEFPPNNILRVTTSGLENANLNHTSSKSPKSLPNSSVYSKSSFFDTDSRKTSLSNDTCTNKLSQSISVNKINGSNPSTNDISTKLDNGSALKTSNSSNAIIHTSVNTNFIQTKPPIHPNLNSETQPSFCNPSQEKRELVCEFNWDNDISIPSSSSVVPTTFKISPPTVLTIIETVPVYMTLLSRSYSSHKIEQNSRHHSENLEPYSDNPSLQNSKNYKPKSKVFKLLRLVENGYVNASSLLEAGGVTSEQERNIVLSLEVGRFKWRRPESQLSGTWVPLSRARALSATCSLTNRVGVFLNDNLESYFPSPLPSSFIRHIIMPYLVPELLPSIISNKLDTSPVKNVLPPISQNPSLIQPTSNNGPLNNTRIISIEQPNIVQPLDFSRFDSKDSLPKNSHPSIINNQFGSHGLLSNTNQFSNLTNISPSVNSFINTTNNKPEILAKICTEKIQSNFAASITPTVPSKTDNAKTSLTKNQRISISTTDSNLDHFQQMLNKINQNISTLINKKKLKEQKSNSDEKASEKSNKPLEAKTKIINRFNPQRLLELKDILEKSSAFRLNRKNQSINKSPN
ncbi:hypothetical protein AYI69_g240 [Smittium culicis]|uniref:HTH APSES-type domain-containing protein n=1 Tax=Smittium culicis TaxID=133412 RepID=A0A1R1YTL0_9FUNG|nr:hypothetical protein AYI69_g240 [Smittium culicis]